MTQKVITALLLVVAFIHLVPITGLLGVARLESLYGVPISGNNMEILMRHRAVLFGILGVFFAYAAFTPHLQPLAFVAALVTLVAFFYLAFTVGGYNETIRKIVYGDIVAAVCLAGAVILYYTRAGD